MKNIFCLGVLAASLFLSLGCAGEKAASTEEETKKLYESSEYENQMMGEMSGESGGTTE